MEANCPRRDYKLGHVTPDPNEKDPPTRFKSKPLIGPILLRITFVLAGVLWSSFWVFGWFVARTDSSGNPRPIALRGYVIFATATAIGLALIALGLFRRRSSCKTVKTNPRKR